MLQSCTKLMDIKNGFYEKNGIYKAYLHVCMIITRVGME
jgi:hypothetical protein